MRRATRWDGWLPNYVPRGVTAEDGQAGLTPEVFDEGSRGISDHRAAEGLPVDGYDPRGKGHDACR